MNRDDIIRMAWEAGFQVLLPQDHVDGTGGVYVVEDEIAGMLERFAALVAAAAEQPKPEPVGVMQESCVMEGLVIPVVTRELPVGTPLYTAPPNVAAEKEQQMIEAGWRKCAVGQRTTQFCGLLNEAVKAEREACAVICDEKAKETFSGQCQVWGDHFARAIRARGET